MGCNTAQIREPSETTLAVVLFTGVQTRLSPQPLGLSFNLKSYKLKSYIGLDGDTLWRVENTLSDNDQVISFLSNQNRLSRSNYTLNLQRTNFDLETSALRDSEDSLPYRFSHHLKGYRALLLNDEES